MLIGIAPNPRESVRCAAAGELAQSTIPSTLAISSFAQFSLFSSVLPYRAVTAIVGSRRVGLTSYIKERSVNLINGDRNSYLYFESQSRQALLLQLVAGEGPTNPDI